MDKEKFLKWIATKTDKLLIETPQDMVNSPETKALMRGVIFVMDEIKAQVESGKFDIKEEI